MPAALQHSWAPAIEVEILMLNPNSASRTAFVHASAASRLSNTAATVVGVSRPAITASKSGLLLRRQCEKGFNDFEERIAPPWRESPRFTGLNWRAISRNFRRRGTEFSSLRPRLAMAKTM